MRHLGYLTALAIAAAARAADPAPADSDSIAAAKKDLASMKAASTQTDSALALPTIDAKDLGPVPGPAPMATPEAPQRDASLDGAKKRDGTGNWLVDAMDKGSDQRMTRPGERGPLTTAEGGQLRSDDRQGAERGGRDSLLPDGGSSPKDAHEAVYNPLDSFMGGWVSNRDRDLLLNSKGEVLAGGEASKGRDELLPGIDGLGLATVDALAEPAAPSQEDLREPNPYLAAMEPGPAVVHSFALPEFQGFDLGGSGGATEGQAGAPADARPLDSTKSFIPDFAQPSGDDKYFKQLKRF